MKINQGKFEGDTYIKQVLFSKAVLWKTREISLTPEIVKQFKWREIKTVIFEDRKKGEIWTADVDKLRDHYNLKQVGQEKQYYFPIEIFKRVKLETNESNTANSN